MPTSLPSGSTASRGVRAAIQDLPLHGTHLSRTRFRDFIHPLDALQPCIDELRTIQGLAEVLAACAEGHDGTILGSGRQAVCNSLKERTARVEAMLRGILHDMPEFGGGTL